MRNFSKKLVCTLLLSAVTAFSVSDCAVASHERTWNLYNKFISARFANNTIVAPLENGNFETAEALAYAMFFALTQKDKEHFDTLLSTVEKTLCRGDISANLPYGMKEVSSTDKDKYQSTVTRANLFLVYDLLTAYEFFSDESYKQKALGLASLIRKECTYSHSILGTLLLPSVNTVAKRHAVTISPNIFAPFVMQKIGQYDIEFLALYDNTVTAVVRGSGDGYVADSLTFNQDGDEIIGMNTVGSFDALRFYLWLGLTCESDPNRRLLIPLYENMLKDIEKDLNVPKVANLYTHEVSGVGTLSYMASTMLLSEKKDRDYFRTVLKNHVFKDDEFYAEVMSLFALGFDDHFFRFDHDGSLILEY